MIGRQEILEFAREVGLDASVVEKDYVLGWMLAGVSENPRTRDVWVFKGVGASSRLESDVPGHIIISYFSPARSAARPGRGYRF